MADVVASWLIVAVVAAGMWVTSLRDRPTVDRGEGAQPVSTAALGLYALFVAGSMWIVLMWFGHWWGPWPARAGVAAVAVLSALLTDRIAPWIDRLTGSPHRRG